MVDDNLVYMEYKKIEKTFKINLKFYNQLIYTLKISTQFMKTEKEIEDFRKDIEQWLIDVSKLPDPMGAMKYYQGALRTLEWVTTGQDI